MQKKILKVINKTGLHARPASAIVQLCSKFSSEITFIKDDVEANAKSIMNILLLAAEPGAEILVKVEGSDEEEALKAVENLFAEKFQEHEY